MATFPAASYISDSGRTKGEAKVALEAIVAAAKQIPGAGVADLAVTIAGGSMTPAGSGGVLSIGNESAAATDDLTNIIPTNYPDGSLILLRNTDAAEVVTIKHAASGTGQIFLDRSADYVLDDELKYLLLHLRGTDWYEVFRGPMRLAAPVVAKNANFTINKQDIGKVFFCTNAITVSFASVAALGNGFTCTIINGNGANNTVVLNPDGSETLNGNLTHSLQIGGVIDLVCDGTAFYSVGKKVDPDLVQVSYASTLTINSREGSYFEVSALTGNVTTFNLDNGYAGKRVTIRFVQDGTGSRTVTLPTNAKVAGSLLGTANRVTHLDLIFVAGGVARWEGFYTQMPA